MRFSANYQNHEHRGRFVEAARSFKASVDSVSDPFGLLRTDTPEIVRYELTLAAVGQHAAALRDGRQLRLCDLGGYFGVVTAAMATYGYEAHLVDWYASLLDSKEHADLRAWWDSRELVVHDLDLQSAGLRLPFEDSSLDVVVLSAVVEHFPHTPRFVLQEARRVLRHDGLLLLDTPNAGAFGIRVGFFLHGEGLWSTVSDIYQSDVPFHGHKRCYSASELHAILAWSGFRPVETVLLDLPESGVTHNLRHRVLYRGIYPLLQRRWPTLRNYIWIAAKQAY